MQSGEITTHIPVLYYVRWYAINEIKWSIKQNSLGTRTVSKSITLRISGAHKVSVWGWNPRDFIMIGYG